MRLLIVILNYRSTDLTIACLRTLESEVGRVPGVTVTVVENGTGGDAVPRLEEAIRSNSWSAWCSLRQQATNLGFTGGNNVAIRESLASADPPQFVLLLNSDTLVEPGALKPLLDFMDAHPRAGIAGNQLLKMDGTPGPSPFRYLGLATELDRGLQLGAVRRLLSRWVGVHQGVDAERAEWVSGACMIVRSALIREIGLLDEGFFTYFEDVDWCVRARDAGWETWYVPESKVFHLEGGSSGVIHQSVRRPAFLFQARRRFFLKHHGPLRTAIIDLAYLCATGFRHLLNLIRGQPRLDPPHHLADAFRYSVFGSGFALEDVQLPSPGGNRPPGDASTSQSQPSAPDPASAGAIRLAVRRVVRAVPLRVWQGVFPKDLVGVCYHIVSDEDLPHHKLYRYKSAAEFETDVAWVRPQALSYDELVRRRVWGDQGQANKVFVSFDDGYAECFDVVRPILRRHQVDAAFFVTSDFMGNDRVFYESRMSLCIARVETMPEEGIQEVLGRLGIGSGLAAALKQADVSVRQRLDLLRVDPRTSATRKRIFLHILQVGRSESTALDDLAGMLGVDALAYSRGRQIFLSPDQIRLLAQDGFTIGAHSVSHRALASASEAKLEREIVDSCAAVRDLTGQARVPFAFPYNAIGVSRATLERILRRNDFVELLFDAAGFGRDVPFMIQRLWGDIPGNGSSTRSNLPNLIQQGWAQRSAWYRTAE